MGRASFGGAADYSYVFANLYNQAANQRKSQIDQAMSDAKRLAQSEDEALIAAWKRGDKGATDKVLLDRLTMRRDEATDPADAAAFDNLYKEYKDSIDDSKAETKFVNDPTGLANYYRSKAGKLNPNSEGYRRAMLRVGQIEKTNGGAGSSPASADQVTYTKIMAAADAATDYKVLLVKAYDGGMTSWPPTTKNGLTQAEVDTLILGATANDVPTGAITPEYIDKVDSEIVSAIDGLVSAAKEKKQPGAAATLLDLKSSYIAKHVTFHNDREQVKNLVGKGGIMDSAFAAITELRKTETDPAKLQEGMKAIRQRLQDWITSASSSAATADNLSGGGTTSSLATFGQSFLGVWDQLVSGKITSDVAYNSLYSSVMALPGSDKTWIAQEFLTKNPDNPNSATNLQMLIMDHDGGGATPFNIAAYLAEGYKGVSTNPPTKAMVYNADTGLIYVNVVKVNKIDPATGKNVTSYQPDLSQVTKALSPDQKIVKIAIDINGKPTVVSAVASATTSGVPMTFNGTDGKPILTVSGVKDLYSKLGNAIVNYMTPTVSAYTITINGKTMTYIGGAVDATGTLHGGMFVTPEQMKTIFRTTVTITGDGKLDALLRGRGFAIPDNTGSNIWSAGMHGEPIVYFGSNNAQWKIAYKSDPFVRDEILQGGGGTDGSGNIVPFDPVKDGPAYDKLYTGDAGTGRVGRLPGLPGGIGGFGGRGGVGGSWTPSSGDRADARSTYLNGRYGTAEYDPYSGATAVPGTPAAAVTTAETAFGDGTNLLRYAPTTNDFSPESVIRLSQRTPQPEPTLPPISQAWAKGAAGLPTPGSTPPPTAPAATPTITPGRGRFDPFAK